MAPKLAKIRDPNYRTLGLIHLYCFIKFATNAVSPIAQISIYPMSHPINAPIIILATHFQFEFLYFS